MVLKPISNAIIALIIATIALIVALVALIAVIIIHTASSPSTLTTSSQTTSPSLTSSPTSQSTTSSQIAFPFPGLSTTSPSIKPEKPLWIIDAVLYRTIMTREH